MKKRALLSIILSAALLMSMLSGCGSKKETEAADAQTSYIGIISAMQNEIDLLLGEADIERTDTIGGVDYYVGKLCGRDVVIATSLVQHDYGQITNEGFEWTAGSEGAPGEEREAGKDRSRAAGGR